MNKLLKPVSHQVKDLDDKDGVVTAYANVYGNEDADGDISMPGSFKKTVKEQKKKIRVYKNHMSFKDIVGVPVELDGSDSYGLLTRTKFLDTDYSQDMYKQIRAIVENNQDADMSVGVIPVRRSDEDRRKVLEWKLKEYSFLTNWGANDISTVQEIKSKNDVDQLIKSLEAQYNIDYSDPRLRAIEKNLEALYADHNDHLQPPDEPSGADKDHSEDELITELHKLYKL